MLSSLSSSSGSFDSAAFARYMLEPDSEGCTPPRITRFSFEDEEARGNLTTSFSGQFSSFYGLPYDSSPPPEESSQYAASEHSSRGPSTPSVPSHLPLSLDPSSPLALSMKPFDDPCMQDTTSLFLDPHSLPPGQSLLSDTPSYLGLVSTRSGELPSRPSRSHSQTMVQPTPPPTTVPTRQTTLPDRDGSRLTNHNRAVTVQQLALEIPMSRSRSGSLSTLIHALEDASPGWYQSLMDSALPQSGSQPALSPVSVPLASAPRHFVGVPRKATGCSPGTEGLPRDMLADLSQLEALAAVVRRLPIPRPRTMALDVVATAFFTPSSSAPSLPSRHTSLQSPPLTPLEEEDERERQPTVRYAATVHSREADRSCEMAYSPRSERQEHSWDSAPADQTTFAIRAHHLKPAKILGMRSSMPAPSRSLAPAPKTPSWRAGRHSAVPRMSAQPIPRAPPPPLPLYDMQAPKPPQTPHKTAKPLNLQSLFRKRPSAPPMPMQQPDLGSISGRNPAKRAAHLSEPVMRPPLRHAGDSISSKSSRHHGAAYEGPLSLPPQSPLGSFLPM